MKRIYLFSLCLFTGNLFLQAQPGTLDNTFDGDGIKVINNAYVDKAQAVAIQPDNKIVVAGYTAGITAANWAETTVYRLNEDGSFDNTFDGDGKKVISVSARADAADAILVQPDGKILIAGFAEGNADNCRGKAFVRLNSDGSLDNTFGTGGIVVYDNNACGAEQRMTGLTLDGNGKIVTVGYYYSGGPNSTGLLAYRLNSDGTLDNSFDGDGKLDVFGPVGNKVRIDAAGKIYISTGDGILKLNTDGSYDTGFGTNGRVTYTNSQAKVLELNNGKIVTVGVSIDQSSTITGQNIISLSASNGAMDNSFGTAGIVYHKWFVVNDAQDFTNFFRCYGNKYLAVGKFNPNLPGDICTGSTEPCYNIASTDNTADFYVALINDDGSLDNSFGTRGGITIPVTPGQADYSFDAAVDGNGRIVLVGYTRSDNNTNYEDFAIVRLTGIATGVKEISNESDRLKLFPNPGNDWYKLEIPESMNNSEIQILLRDALGKEVNIEIEKQSATVYTFSLQQLPANLYLLELLENGKVSERIKLIKK